MQAGLPAAYLPARSSPGPLATAAGNYLPVLIPEYEQYDALGLASLIRSGAVAPMELVESCIARIEALDPTLNAVVYRAFDEARSAACAPLPDGPFRGIPFLIKDLLALWSGVPMRGGSRFTHGLRPDVDSELVARYRRAGLVLTGKTNVPELGITPFTEPAAFGATRNPWRLDRTPGGSSGGAAAAVAAGIVPAAHANDGGGSIRIPASCCGLFGLKPSRGRMPTGPLHSDTWHGCVTEHVLTRSVRDSAAMLDVTAGAERTSPHHLPVPAGPYLPLVTRDPRPLRIAFTARPFLGGRVHPECQEGLGRTVSLLTSLGHHVDEAEPPIDGAQIALDFLTMICASVAAEVDLLAGVLGRHPSTAELEPGTWILVLIGRGTRAPELEGALRRLRAVGHVLDAFFDRYDVLLTPTLAEPPVPVGSLQPAPSEAILARGLTRLRAGWMIRAIRLLETLAERVFHFIPYTPVFNVTGQPAMSVPLHWTADGLPVGMHFAARLGDEATLFQLAGQLERASPWVDRRPPHRFGEAEATGRVENHPPS